MTGAEIPRDASGRVIRPRPSQLLTDVMEKLGPDHLTTRTLMAALIERDRGAGVEPRAVTPKFGWHIPVLADPPNVPYDMTENSLDIEATISTLPWGSIAYSSASVPNGVTRLVAVTAGLTATGGGVTVSNGFLVIPEPGLYLASAWVQSAGAGYGSPKIKNEANGASIPGTYGQAHSAGSQHLAAGLLNVLAPNTQVGLYVAADVARTVTGQLDMVWQGKP